MACNINDPNGRCRNQPEGDGWFLAMARDAGFNFDYVTFHYYPSYIDLGYWYNMYLTQMRDAATKYKVPIFLNETNCGEIYSGTTDGGYPGDHACYDGLSNFINELKAHQSDIVQEVNFYELLDEPNQAGAEAHFGLMYDVNDPKATLKLAGQAWQ
jgi:hypothetical protein